MSVDLTDSSVARGTQAPLPGAARRRPVRIARGTLAPEPSEIAARPGDGAWSEPLRDKLLRRLVSIPAMAALTGAYTAALPTLVAGSVARDAMLRRPQVLARFHLTMAGILWWHWVGLAALSTWWIAGGGPSPHRPAGWRRWNMQLEGWWGHWVIRIPELLYGMQIDVSGDDQLRPGPVIVLARHTSIIDTMLPLRILEHDHGMVARIVKKRALLWDPCVDGISQRMPRTFVKRNDPDGDLELLRTLCRGLGPDDGVWIFPEGTRFTHSKRKQIIDKLRATRPVAADRAERLSHTLPPKPAGTLAILEECPGRDVLFCAHTGMEGSARLEDFVHGSLLHRKVKVQFWRVPAAEIPLGHEARVEWLHGWWEKIDRWVAEHQDPDLTALLARQ